MLTDRLGSLMSLYNSGGIVQKCMFISVDPQAGSYPGTYPYTCCGGNPMNRVDPTGEDYWSTSDPNVIYEFRKHYNENKGISGYGFDGWYQMSNKEFLAAYEAYGADALTYNDQTATLYSSEGKVENGQVVIYGHIDQLGLSRDVVTKTIMKDIAKKTTEIVEGRPFNQRIEIMGHRLQYTAYKLSNGKINIGRIHQIE